MNFHIENNLIGVSVLNVQYIAKEETKDSKIKKYDKFYRNLEISMNNNQLTIWAQSDKVNQSTNNERVIVHTFDKSNSSKDAIRAIITNLQKFIDD